MIAFFRNGPTYLLVEIQGDGAADTTLPFAHRRAFMLFVEESIVQSFVHTSEGF